MYGGLAQLGEHLLCKQGVVGSIPSSSTKPGGCCEFLVLLAVDVLKSVSEELARFCVYSVEFVVLGN